MDTVPVAPGAPNGGAPGGVVPAQQPVPVLPGLAPGPQGSQVPGLVVPIPGPARTGAFSRVRARWLPVWAIVGMVALTVPLMAVEGALSATDFDEVMTFAMYLPIVAWVWLMVVRRAGVELGAMFRWPRLGAYWAVVAGMFAIQFVFSIAAITLTELLVPGFDDALGDMGTGNVVLAMLGIVIVPPLVEETLFRGVLIERFAVKWRLWVGILLSAVLFAVLHVDPLGALMFGVVTTLLYLRTGSLWPGILLHATNNLVALASIRATGPQAEQGVPPDTVESLTTAGVLLLVAVPFLAWFIHATWPRAGHLTPYQVHELRVGLPERSIEAVGWSGLPGYPVRAVATPTHLVVAQPVSHEAIAVLPLESIRSLYTSAVPGGELVVVLLVDGSWTTLQAAGGIPARNRELATLIRERAEQAAYRAATSPATAPIRAG